MPSQTITRITLFKIPDPKDRATLLSKYQTAQTDALKDGKPYIISIAAGNTADDARNQGYNFAAKTEFASLEDWAFYDTECEAHKRIKAFAGSVHRGSMMLYFENEV